MDETREIHYDAFISYRHCELDSFVAENLHKKLENFRMPRSVLSKVKNGKTKIERVFRDVDELPLADNLSEPIIKALDNSDFLITICSPRYPESKWCMKEIEIFLKKHDRKHILVVLAEDEPENSFPKILTFDEYVQKDEKGNNVIVRREIEPLAADTRGGNKKEIMKAMDIAVIKLCAAIFGLGYDDLRQRHREQKIRRMAFIFGSIGAAVLVFAVFTTIMLIKISKQNTMISNQNDELQDKNGVITSQNQELQDKNELITSQNQELQEKNELITSQNQELQDKNELITSQYSELEDRYAGSMVNAAEKFMGMGRRKDAVYALRNVLPDNDSGYYNASAAKCLYEILNIYGLPGRYFPERTYEAETPLNTFLVSGDGIYIALDDEESITLYDTGSGTVIRKFMYNEIYTEGFDTFDFCGSDGILFYSSDMEFYSKAAYYSIAADEIKELDFDSLMCASVKTLNLDNSEVLLVYSEGHAIALGSNGEMMYSISFEEQFGEGLSLPGDISCANGNFFLPLTDGETYVLVLIDGLTGNVEQVFKDIGIYGQEKSLINNDYIYFFSNYYSKNEYGVKSCLTVIEIQSGEIKLEKNYEDCSFTRVITSEEMLYVLDGNTIKAIDPMNGDIVSIFYVDSYIINWWVDPENEDCYYIDDEGKIYTFCSENKLNVTDNFLSAPLGKGPQKVIYLNHQMYILLDDSRYVSRYVIDEDQGKFLDLLSKFEENFDIEEDASALEKIENVDGIETNTIHFAGYSNDKSKIFVIFKNDLVGVYDADTLEQLRLYEIEGSQYAYIGYLNAIEGYVINNFDKAYLLNSNYDIYCETGWIAGESENELVISFSNAETYGITYVSYNEMIRRADEFLDGYEPSSMVRQTYNIL